MPDSSSVSADGPPPVVYILLATYNGSAYLEEQVSSILAQTYPHWRLAIRDDCSTDDTAALAAGLAGRDPRIEVVAGAGAGNLGPRGSFGALLEWAAAAGAPYACFCDQDDVWYQDKLAVQLSLLRDWEVRVGTGCPILIYSDLAVVDQGLRPLHDSFYAFQGIRRGTDEPPLPTLLAQNHVVGCTTLMNRALIRLATPIPADVHMHDWWVALCARACGVVVLLPRATVRYRQHADNQVGAGGVRRLRRVGAWAATLRKMNRLFRRSILQARHLGERMRAPGCRAGCPESDLAWEGRLNDVAAWGRLCDMSLIGRLSTAVRWRLRSQNLVLTALLYVQLLAARWTCPPGPREG